MSAPGTPYDLIFRNTSLVAEYFPRIRGELPADDGVRDRDAFFTSASVGELLRAIAPESSAGAAQIGLFTYHAFQHWLAGERVWSLEEAVLRDLLLPGAPIGEWQFATPAAAGYFQLPRHRFWVASEPGAPAEPIDGFFWVTPERSGGYGPDLLLLLGMHAGRDGISVVELAPAPLPPAGHWGDLDVRGDGQDFANILPGGEHLLGLQTAGEALKLASRVFWHLRTDGSIRDRTGPGGDR